MTEEDGRAEKKIAEDALDAERRIKTMDAISDTRKAFLDSHMRNTARHLTTLAKGVGANTEAGVRDQEAEEVEIEYGAVEDEWLKRKEELMEAREVIVNREKDRYVSMVNDRVENLVRNVGKLGINEVTQKMNERGVNLGSYPGKKVLFPVNRKL